MTQWYMIIILLLLLFINGDIVVLLLGLHQKFLRECIIQYVISLLTKSKQLTSNRKKRMFLDSELFCGKLLCVKRFAFIK